MLVDPAALPPPTGDFARPAGGPTDPDVAGDVDAATRRKRTVLIGGGLVAVVVALTLVVMLAAGGGEDTSLEEVEDAAWASCFVFNTGDDDTMDYIWQQEHDGKITPSVALEAACAVRIRQVDGGWTVRWGVDEDVAGGAGLYAISSFGEQTGCLNDVDLERMAATRPLDGTVESHNGRSQWSYSADSGFVLTCET